MISLFLDTSSSNLNVGVLKDKKLLKEKYIHFEKDLSKYALNEIKELLDSLSLKPNDIDNIYCVNGPGSFTGLRIGVTIAKTFAWGLNKDLYKVSSLFAMATSNTNSCYVIPLIDARRNYVFATIYDNVNKSFILKEQYISINTLEAAMGNLGDDITYISNDKLDTEYSIQEYVPDISYIVENVMNREGINPHSVDANYLKMTEAEENL